MNYNLIKSNYRSVFIFGSAVDKSQAYKQELAALRKVLEKYTSVEKKYKLKIHEAELLQEQIKQSPQHKV